MSLSGQPNAGRAERVPLTVAAPANTATERERCFGSSHRLGLVGNPNCRLVLRMRLLRCIRHTPDPHCHHVLQSAHWKLENFPL